MVTKEYAKAYKEVIEILNHVPDEDVIKIPKENLDFYKLNMDNTYEYELDETKEFEEQKMSEIAKAILANLYRDYWASPEQKEKIIEKDKHDLKKIEEEKRKKYNPEDIFKNRKSSDIAVENTSLPMQIKKENFLRRLIKFIKNIVGEKREGI